MAAGVVRGRERDSCQVALPCLANVAPLGDEGAAVHVGRKERFGVFERAARAEDADPEPFGPSPRRHRHRQQADVRALHVPPERLLARNFKVS